MSEIAVKIEDLKKQYRLGTIGGGTLSADLQSWWARKRGREDPNIKIGMKQTKNGEIFNALDGINLEVRKGEALGIIGTNGAGKSTLLKLLSRVTAPTEGRICINGRITSMLEVGTGFHPELTGRENIYMNGAILGMTKSEIDQKVEEIIEFSECRQFINTPVKRYSSGMYVKLAFAVAAHLDAEILIMDEVLAVGDMKFQQKCLGKMGSAANEEDKTILYVSHNMNTIRQLCTRCIVLKQGKIIYDGDVEKAIEVYSEGTHLSDAVVNLEDIKRAPEFMNHIATLKRIEIFNSDNSKFKVGSSICGVMDVSTGKNVEQAYLRIIIRAANGDAVTMVTSKNALKLEKEKNNKIRFELDISGLVPGVYTLSPVLYEVNDYGTDATLDGLHNIYKYEVEPIAGFNNNMEWKPQYWGYVKMGELKTERG